MNYIKKFMLTMIINKVVQHKLVVLLLSITFVTSSCYREDLYNFVKEYQTVDYLYFYALKKDNENKVYFCISNGADYYREYFITTDPSADMPTCAVLYNNTLLVKVSNTMYVYTIVENDIIFIKQAQLVDQNNTTIPVTYPFFAINNSIYCITSTILASLFKYDNYNNNWLSIHSFSNPYNAPRTVTRVGNTLLFESDTGGGGYAINVFDLLSTQLTQKVRPYESIFLHRVDSNFYLGYNSGPGNATICKIEESSYYQIAPPLSNIAFYAYTVDFNNTFWAAAADNNDSLYTKIATIENNQWIIKASTNTVIQYSSFPPYYPKLIAFSPTKLVLFTIHYLSPNNIKYLFVYDIPTNTIMQLTEDTFPGIQYITYVCAKDRD